MKCSLKLLILISLLSSCASTRPDWTRKRKEYHADGKIEIKKEYYVKLVGGNTPLQNHRLYLREQKRLKKLQELRSKLSVDSTSIEVTNDY